jgi:hypothetical protein
MDPAIEKTPGRDNLPLSLHGVSPALADATTSSAANVDTATYTASKRLGDRIDTMNLQTSFQTND